VLKQPNEQWWYAVSTKGEYGYVPSHCLVPIKEAAGMFTYLEIPGETPEEDKQAGTRTQVSAINRGKHVTVYPGSSAPDALSPSNTTSMSSSSSSATSSTSPTSLTSSSSTSVPALPRLRHGAMSSDAVRIHKRRLTAFSDESVMEALEEEQNLDGKSTHLACT